MRSVSKHCQRKEERAMNNVNTLYDDVFRTLLTDCKSLIISVVNEVFGEHFTGEEKVILKENEIFLRQQDGGEEKRITDSSFAIVGIGSSDFKQYHLECQSTPGGCVSYPVRVMKVKEYDIDEIFEKNLLFLIPFYIFSYESSLS